MTLTEIEPDMLVTYVPTHADGSCQHVDSEQGIVTEVRREYVFARFEGRTTAQACRPEQLVRG